MFWSLWKSDYFAAKNRRKRFQNIKIYIKLGFPTDVSVRDFPFRIQGGNTETADFKHRFFFFFSVIIKIRILLDIIGTKITTVMCPNSAQIVFISTLNAMI